MANYVIARKLRDKATIACGLTTILKDDVDTMRSDVSAYDIDRLSESVQDISETLSKLSTVVSEIEYLIYVKNRNTEIS